MSDVSKRQSGKTRPYLPHGSRMVSSAGIARNVKRQGGAIKIKDGLVVLEPQTRKKRYDPMAFYRELYAVEPMDEVAIVRHGVPFGVVRILAQDLAINEKQVLQALHIPKSTFARRVKNDQPMNTEESERTLALAKLIAEAERIYRESGDADAPDFDVQAWVGRWIERRNQALGGRTPAEMLDTSIGRSTVLGLMRKMQSGAYA